MKKIFLFFLVLVTMTVSAQKIGLEELIPEKIAGDPVLGTVDRVVWKSAHAQVENGQYGPVITLKHEGSVFVGGLPKFGLYNEQDQLIGIPYYCTYTMPSKDRLFYNIMGAVFSEDSIPGSDRPNKEKNEWRLKIEDLVKWMKESNGSFRIVLNTFGDNLYDIKLKFRREE